jgi:hypothetical protein
MEQTQQVAGDIAEGLGRKTGQSQFCNHAGYCTGEARPLGYTCITAESVA